MKISAVNSSKIKYHKLFRRKKARPSQKFCVKNSYEIKDKFSNYIIKSKISALSKLNKINIEEYKSLTIIEKMILRKAFIIEAKGDRFSNPLLHLKLHNFASECIRQVFDKKYGVGNYIVIPIGRSLSSISKLLSFKIGEEHVKNIPLSNLQGVDNYGNNPMEYFNKYADKAAYKKYLESIGLSRKNIESSNKKYILLDYTITGDSLKNAYKILTSDYFLGNKKNNITFASIKELLPSGNYQKEKERLLIDLSNQSYKNYSFVSRLNIINETNIKQSIDIENMSYDNTIKYIKKIFGFSLLDNYYKKIFHLKKYNITFNTENVKINKLNEIDQFNKDVYIDMYELEKALLIVTDNTKTEKIKELQNKLNSTHSNTYYTTLRAEIKNFLNTVF